VQRQPKKTENDSDNQEDSEGVSIPPVKPQMISQVDRGHSRAVCDIIWLNQTQEVNKKGELAERADAPYPYQFATVAGDGHLLFWDLRVNHWKNPQVLAKEEADPSREVMWYPVCSIPLARPEGSGNVMATKMAKQDETNVCMVSEDGEFCRVDWIAKIKAAEEKTTVNTVQRLSQGHFQACTAVQQSPHFPDYFLTVGDWTFTIWKIGLTEPVFKSACASDYLTTGAWSPSRPGIIVMARADGSIDVWDLLDQCHKPSLNFSVGSDKITSLRFWPPNQASVQYLAVGDCVGKLHVLEVPRNLRRPITGEDSLVQNFYDREIMRVDYAKAQAPIRKAKQAAEQQAKPAATETETKQASAEQAEEQAKAKESERAKIAAEEEMAEQAYQKLLKEYREKLGGED